MFSSHTVCVRGWQALLLSLAFWLNGCAMFNQEFDDTAVLTDHGQPLPYGLEILQLDDYGSLWRPQEADRVLQVVAAAAQAQNTYVVTFIHGWHNNAAPDNGNLKSFKQALGGVYAELSAPERAKMRLALTGTADFRLVGVYIGWRGRSLPGVLDYATAWGRKSAAERAGSGDVSEFLARLQRLYVRANEYDDLGPPHPPRVKRPFLGVVNIGHSFGSQVLLAGMGKTFEYLLAERAPDTANVLDPKRDSSRAQECIRIGALGDLNVLVNPAVEAYQFARIDALYQQLNYPAVQSPQLVVFSANNDWARRSMFPIERALTGPFRPWYRDDNAGYQGTLWGRALGEVDAQLTHQMAKTAIHTPDSLNDSDFAVAGGQKVAQFDFSGELTFGDVALMRYTSAGGLGARSVSNSPVLVVQTTPDIINGHDGIFLPAFIGFLVKYVSFIEGKQVMQRYEALNRQEVGTAPVRPECAKYLHVWAK